MYTIETLKPLNPTYLVNHSLNERDVNKVNALIQQIEGARQGEPVPQDGDDVICVKPDGGVVYEHGHLEEADWRDDGTLAACVQPYVPFIHPGSGCSASGGYWFTVPQEALQYIGKRMKTFCTWGHLGPDASGAIDFQAEVNLWQYTGKEVY